MESQLVKTLMTHGSVVLLFGIMAGFPFWISIIRKLDKSTIRAWRVAHTTLISFGLFSLLAGLIVPYLNLEKELFYILRWSFVISGYNFVFALFVGALTGYRALIPAPLGFNTLFFVGHLIGAIGSLLAGCIILYGLI